MIWAQLKEFTMTISRDTNSAFAGNPKYIPTILEYARILIEPSSRLSLPLQWLFLLIRRISTPIRFGSRWPRMRTPGSSFLILLLLRQLILDVLRSSNPDKQQPIRWVWTSGNNVAHQSSQHSLKASATMKFNPRQAPTLSGLVGT